MNLEKRGKLVSLIILILFSTKHFIFDFLWQTKSEVVNKGKYGNLKGISHSVKHGVGTFIVLTFFTPVFIPLALLDFLIHYHVDWIKMNYGEQDPSNSKFWRDFGLDQLAHAFTYIGLTFIALKYSY